jgi:lipopolysaccharide transport system permease protein
MNNAENNALRKPTVLSPPKSWELPDFHEIWQSHELMALLAIRNLKVRFKQTSIGIFWIVLQPLILMAIFSVILGVLVKVPTGNVPYPIFFLSGFFVWQFFYQVVNSSAFGMLEHIGVISKSYFPRMVLPFSYTLSSFVDFFVILILLLAYLLVSGFSLNVRYLLLPILFVCSIIISTGVAVLFSAWMILFRDIKNLLAFILMVWMYLTPVMYPIALVPEEYRFLIRINPLTTLVEAYRWVLLGTGDLPPAGHFIAPVIVTVLIWIVAAFIFRKMENKISDVL